MLVFHKERLVFLAVPKTGSTAYHQALAGRADMVVSGPPGLKHAPLYRYDRFFRPIFDKMDGIRMETLAVMREPVSWLGSWYRYRGRPSLDGQPNSTAGMSFDAFVEGYLRGQRPPFADVGSQARFLTPRPAGDALTHLFRYEDLAPLDRFLETRLGIAPKLARLNVSPERPLELSARLERRLRRKHAADFALYDSIG